MARFNLDEYETVETRLQKLWAEHSNKTVSIETNMPYYDDKRVVFKATIDILDLETGQEYTATGYAEETRGEGPVNRTSHVENCETSAIGRALANLNYATKGKRPSREEMSKVQRVLASQPIVWPYKNSQDYNKPITEVDDGLLVWYKTNKQPADGTTDKLYDAVVAELARRGE
jgi:hypothetical protein